MRKLVPALFALALSSCFNSQARFPFTDAGEQRAMVKLKAGKVRFATEIEARYSGDAVGRYDVELSQQGKVVSHATCNPLEVTGSKTCFWRYGNQDNICNFVMKCSAYLETGGPTVLRVRFSVPTKPENFVLKRADLIVGQ